MNLNIEFLQKKFGNNLKVNENLSKYSWFNLGGTTDIFFRPDSTDELANFLKEAKVNSYKVHILGAGSNTLVNDDLFDGIVIKLSKNFTKVFGNQSLFKLN